MEKSFTDGTFKINYSGHNQYEKGSYGTKIDKEYIKNNIKYLSKIYTVHPQNIYSFEYNQTSNIENLDTTISIYHDEKGSNIYFSYPGYTKSNNNDYDLWQIEGNIDQELDYLDFMIFNNNNNYHLLQDHDDDGNLIYAFVSTNHRFQLLFGNFQNQGIITEQIILHNDDKVFIYQKDQGTTDETLYEVKNHKNEEVTLNLILYTEEGTLFNKDCEPLSSINTNIYKQLIEPYINIVNNCLDIVIKSFNNIELESDLFKYDKKLETEDGCEITFTDNKIPIKVENVISKIKTLAKNRG